MSEENQKNPAYRQNWIESERGMGQRPDGASLHLSKEDAEAYVKAYWARMPSGSAPEAYSKQDGNPFLVLVAWKIYQALLANKEEERLGVRFNQTNIPDMEY